MAVGVSGKLHQLANYYRTLTGVGKRDEVSAFNDTIFLVSYFTNLCVDYIRNIVSIVAQLPQSQPVMTLRIQLSNALAVGLDFSTRVVTVFANSHDCYDVFSCSLLQTLNSGNVLEKTGDFLKSDFPVIHHALVAVKNFAVGSKVCLTAYFLLL